MIKKNVITWIAETINKGTTYNHKVNLDSPDLVILVKIIKVSIAIHSCSVYGADLVTSVLYEVNIIACHCMRIYIYIYIYIRTCLLYERC